MMLIHARWGFPSIDGSGLHLVHQFETRFGIFLGAPHVIFNTKFFCIEPKFTLTKLGITHQYLGEDLDAYVKRFHEKPLYCCDLVAEEVPVDVGLE